MKSLQIDSSDTEGENAKTENFLLRTEFWYALVNSLKVK